MSPGEENRSALAAGHPDVMEALEAAGASPKTVQVIPTPSGNPTAVRAGIFLHSRYDPRIEGERLAARDVDETASAAIVMGFGLGYVVEAVRRRHPRLPILVLEPDAATFAAALDARDLARLLSDPLIVFHVASRPQDVSTLLAGMPLARPVFLRLRPAVELDNGWFRVAEEICQSWLLRREINLNTLARFGKLWVRNLARNLQAFAEAPGISRLSGLCRGLPALVIAGGPSLDALVPRLGQLRERMVIISVNTPLKRCVDAGVEPDFVVVVDPQYWASRFMDWTENPAAARIVVAEPSTHPRLLRGPPASAGTVYFCSSLFPLGETLEAALGEKGKLGAGGSVSTAAWDLARHLGASPIYLAGLDLGYPAMRTHCRGVFTEELWLVANDRSRPLETSSFRSLREIGLFPVPSSRGSMTMTDRRMLLYKWWFENQLVMHPDAASFTLCPDSVAIAGMPLASVEEALRLPVVRKEIEARIAAERAAAKRSAPAGAGGQALRQVLNELAGGLEELESLSEQALRANESLGSVLSGPQRLDRRLEELDSLDSRILAVSQRSIAGFLIQSLIHRIEDKGEGKSSPKEAIDDATALYRGIRDSAKWQKEIICKALDEMKTR